MGWSDPTSLPRKPWRSLQPSEQERLCSSCLPVSSEAKEEKKERRPNVGQYQTTMVKREYELQEPIAVAVEKYAAFIQSNQIVSSIRRSRGPLVKTLPKRQRAPYRFRPASFLILFR
jgi:hypothetical protein